MENLPLNREVILSRVREIEKFETDDNFAIAEHYLRRALEAVFDIGNHILSRVPGVRVSTYKEIALGLYKEKLVKMAGYRNRLIHFYAEVSVEELYEIIQKNLEDFEEFLRYIKELIENPEKFGLTIS